MARYVPPGLEEAARPNPNVAIARRRAICMVDLATAEWMVFVDVDQRIVAATLRSDRFEGKVRFDGNPVVQGVSGTTQGRGRPTLRKGRDEVNEDDVAGTVGL